MVNVYQQIMGQELGDIFWALACEVRSLSCQYDDSEYLFGDGSENRVLMMNRAAPAFFHRVEITFERELMLGICRITDPEKSVGKGNLTVNRLAGLVEQKLPGFGGRIRDLADSAKVASDFARDWRNRWLAHKDLDLSIGSPSVKPLSDATLGKIDTALTAIDDVLKSVSSAFQGNNDGFRRITEFGGGASLIRVIDEGLRVLDQRTTRIQTGIATEDDLVHLTQGM